MSQQALFLITTENLVRDACRGWKPPLARARMKKHTNPFTGEVSEVSTRVPAELEDDLAEPSVEDIEAGLEFPVFDALAKARPVSIEFTIPQYMREAIKSAPVVLYGGVHGEVHEIKRVEPSRETEMLEFFPGQVDEWTDERKRREKGLSLFVYVYSF
jgi:hypothetical protein